MTSCRQQIRSFVLGIIVWGVLVMFLKSFKKTEAFGNESTDSFNRLFGSTGSKIPGWGSGGEDNTRIENSSELATANDLIARINASTGSAISKIQDALRKYEDARALAGSTIDEKVKEHQQQAQTMINSLSDSLGDAAQMIRDKKPLIDALRGNINDIAATGSRQWNQILNLFEDEDEDAFTQPKRRRSGNVPKPSVAATSLGN